MKKASELLPFNKLLGVRIVRRHSDGVTIEVEIRGELLNSAGAVHGGVLASMADTASGIALHHHFGGRRPITTTDLKINYLRPITQGKVVARSHLVCVGKTLGVGRVELSDSQRNLAAIAIVTYMILS
ncbi:MAG TPA: PaaI family thioesterase [Bryobacteraceae bacterium]|jgi:acyl-CoA thioesterase|nr:PaaI family thioesterase [Bryobacteraceae bacterium]